MCDGCKPLPREGEDFRGPRDPACPRYARRAEINMMVGVIFAGVFCLVVGACDYLSGFEFYGPLEGLFTGGIALIFFGTIGVWYRTREQKKKSEVRKVPDNV